MSEQLKLEDRFKGWHLRREPSASPAAVAFVLKCIESHASDEGVIDVADRYDALYGYAELLATIRGTHFRGASITTLV